MLPSVHAFLSQIVDYAGMFPPAKLPLEDAVGNYLDYRRTSPHAWMLGRMVCPVQRLHDLSRLTAPEVPLSLTALGRQSSLLGDIVTGFASDVNAIREFRAAWGRDNAVDMVEVALPKDVEIGTVCKQLPDVVALLAQAHLRGFLEIPFGPSWSSDVETVAGHLQGPSIGLKLRAGGVTADAFPSEAQIAFFIDRCRAAKLPWKATAGLHHPRRHWDSSLALWHHGFLNVFGAGLLAQNHPLTEADLVAILSDRTAEHFRFDPDGFAWKDWACSTARIVESRANAATSFGSCSFAEPIDDLIALGFI